METLTTYLSFDSLYLSNSMKKNFILLANGVSISPIAAPSKVKSVASNSKPTTFLK